MAQLVVRLGIKGLLDQDSASVESLCCVFEQDTLSIAYIVRCLVQSKKTHPDITEYSLTGM